MRRKLLPHEKAAFLLNVEKQAAVLGAFLWTVKSLTLNTEGAIVSFAEFSRSGQLAPLVTAWVGRPDVGTDEHMAPTEWRLCHYIHQPGASARWIAEVRDNVMTLSRVVCLVA
jgi:hypothetical protein